MSRRTLRTFAQATTCLAVGVAFTAGCLYAATPDDLAGPRIVPSSGQPIVVPSPVTSGSPLSSEEIDVLAEGDDADHPWEQCRINTDLWVTCPDGSRIEYPAPLDDGSVTVEHAFDDQQDLPTCMGGEALDAVEHQPDLPCKAGTPPTYVEGGDGVRHDGCYLTLLSDEDSEMVCHDDTVWAS